MQVSIVLTQELNVFQTHNNKIGFKLLLPISNCVFVISSVFFEFAISYVIWIIITYKTSICCINNFRYFIGYGLSFIHRELRKHV